MAQTDNVSFHSYAEVRLLRPPLNNAAARTRSLHHKLFELKKRSDDVLMLCKDETQVLTQNRK